MTGIARSTSNLSTQSVSTTQPPRVNPESGNGGTPPSENKGLLSTAASSVKEAVGSAAGTVARNPLTSLAVGGAVIGGGLLATSMLDLPPTTNDAVKNADLAAKQLAEENANMGRSNAGFLNSARGGAGVPQQGGGGGGGGGEPVATLTPIQTGHFDGMAMGTGMTVLGGNSNNQFVSLPTPEGQLGDLGVPPASSFMSNLNGIGGGTIMMNPAITGF